MQYHSCWLLLVLVVGLVAAGEVPDSSAVPFASSSPQSCRFAYNFTVDELLSGERLQEYFAVVLSFEVNFLRTVYNPLSGLTYDGRWLDPIT